MNEKLQPVKSAKGMYPFRLGTTSYIIPDDLVPNVEYLADKVDDIELVLFESDEISNIPDRQLVRKFYELAAAKDLTYTVHLPLDANLGSSSEKERISSVGKCLRIIERMAPLEPFAYIMHFHGDCRGKCPSQNLAGWRASLEKSTAEILACGIAPGDLCVETLDYPFELIEDIVFDHQLSICLDLGHLIYYDFPPLEHLERYLDRTRVIHLHGISEGKDHRAVSYIEPKLLSEMLAPLYKDKKKERVVTLEVFNETDLVNSLKALARIAI
jgi:adenosylcobalamin phosphodiesterase